MEAGQNLRETLENTLAKYKINREKVPLAELEGRYKKSYDKLKEELKQLTNDYLLEISVKGFKIGDDADELIEQMQKRIHDSEIGKRAGTAIFKNYSLSELEAIGAEVKQMLTELYNPYFDRHCCLYIRPENLDPENPKTPWVYNDLIDKFWSFDRECWETRPKPEGGAALMFIRPKEGET